MLGLVGALAGTAAAAIPAWTTYRHDAARSGYDPESTEPVAPTRAWQSTELEGPIYAEPLVYGPNVYVATENDTIYSLNAATGAVEWEAQVGNPVPGGEIGCNSIAPTVGITSTPVIDPDTNTIYAVTTTWDGEHSESIAHDLVALDLTTGKLRAKFPRRVDPTYPAEDSASIQLQRPALALDGSQIIIGFGSYGDCSRYHGWLVGAPTIGEGALHVYEADEDAGHYQGAFWGSGNGPPVEANGDLYAATGNGCCTAPFDFGDAVLKFTSSLSLVEYWAPEDWMALDEEDLDLGSSYPVLLPHGWAFEIGKQGVGALMRTDSLGGVSTAPVEEQVCDGSWGGGVYLPESAAAGSLYLTCSNGLQEVSVSGLNTPTPTLNMGWSVPEAVGPPILAGGLVWVAASYQAPHRGVLYGIEPGSGNIAFEENLGSFDDFATPSAGGGLLFAATEKRVTALKIGEPPARSATVTTLQSSLNPSRTREAVQLTANISPAPDSGTVRFSDSGTPIPECTEVPIAAASNGHVGCQVELTEPGAHELLASYSGDSYYVTSTSSPLRQVIDTPTTTVLSSSANPAAAGSPVKLVATVTPAPDGGTVAFSDGGTPLPGCEAIAVTGAAAGTATCEATPTAAGTYNVLATYSGATGYEGSISAQLEQVVYEPITAIPTSPLAPMTSPPVAQITAVPVAISDATQSHSRWREGDALAQISRRTRHSRGVPVGTQFTFALNESANVALTFDHRGRGFEIGGHCVTSGAKLRGANTYAESCTSSMKAVLLFKGHAGSNRVAFQGRLSKSIRLRPGRYTVAFNASEPSGAPSQAGPLSFTIVN